MLYELRIYNLNLGTLPRYMEAFGLAVPGLRKHANLLGFWHTESGELNSVYHLWVYPTYERRAEQISAYRAEPSVQVFLKTAIECVATTRNIFLAGAPFMGELPIGALDHTPNLPLP